MLRHPASLLEGTTMTRSRLSSLVGLGLAVLLAGSLTACATETPGSPPDPTDVAAPEEESQLAAQRGNICLMRSRLARRNSNPWRTFNWKCACLAASRIRWQLRRHANNF